MPPFHRRIAPLSFEEIGVDLLHDAFEIRLGSSATGGATSSCDAGTDRVTYCAEKASAAPEKEQISPSSPASPRSVVGTRGIFANKSAPPKRHRKESSSSSSSCSFLPPLLTMLSLSFDSDEDDIDECFQDEEDKNSSSSESAGSSGLQSILKSSFYNACISNTPSQPSTYTCTMRKSVSFSNLNEVKSIPAIDKRIKAKRSRSTPDAQISRDDRRASGSTTMNSMIDAFASPLTCVSSPTCDSFSYYSSAVQDDDVPLMSVYNIEEEFER
mmetsp:Transcript_2331/g.6784  ORF Transcript_2331/g.6784 Transcript_2331/m.6784 type:complete len:271 (-) Transcript_2331:253-1065(-)|eukprot:CAMPEP_0181049182 /NCGR_PEP_ID=MMETSP1070-20121207/15837_1 /TAXON_ID=265543 /ORGANISM="Minutocellus polymorphus, Strain NH13" /LENGTH=270 /DNA_ID=CAMNT_0023128025 /DNA_START=161 /DNA_END=973 /DNA_ORIENTATION=-